MFETSVIRAHVHSGHRYRLLSLSLAAHACAIAAVITATVITTRLPVEAPKQMAIFIPTAAPPPALGTPDAKPVAPRHAAAPVAAARTPAAPVAPQVLPEKLPVSPSDAITPASTDTGGGDGPAVGPIGVPDGIRDSIGTDTSATGHPVSEGVPLHIGGEVKAPVILQRVMPEYPRVAVLGRINGWVVVECIIDKTGHIREAKVVKSSFAAFEQPALEAVQKWVFTPGSLHGDAVDTIFDLTVTFQVR